MMQLRVGVRKGNNQGLVVCTAGPDLLHIIPVGRTFMVRKIIYYNPTVANINVILGTVTNAAGWVPLMSAYVSIAGLDDQIPEEEIPAIEFVNDRTAGAAGVTGSLWVTAALNLQIRVEVEEFGA